MAGRHCSLLPGRNDFSAEFTPIAIAHFSAAHLRNAQSRQAMAFRIDHKLARTWANIFQGDPNATHIAGRIGGEMDGVLMRVLLAAMDKGQRLAGPWSCFEKQIEK